MTTMAISERMELQRAALAGARRQGAGALAPQCASDVLDALEGQLDDVPVGRRLAWVTREAADHARRQRRRSSQAEVGERCTLSSRWLDEALRVLEPDVRRVVELTYGEGLTAVEIGGLLGCSVEHVAALRNRGRRRMAAPSR